MTNGTSPPLALLKNLFETQLLSKYDKHLFFAEVLDSKPALSKLDDSEAPMRFQFALTRPSTSTAWGVDLSADSENALSIVQRDLQPTS